MKQYKNFGLGTYDDYVPQNLIDNYSINELRKEYARLRKEANKNISELLGSRYASQEFVQDVASGFSYRSTMGKRELAYQLSKLATFQTSQRSSVAGFEEFERNIQAKFKAATGIEVPLGDILDLRDFMRELRERGVFRTYDSEKAVDWFEQYAEKYDGDTELAAERFMNRFHTWQEHREAALAEGKRYNRTIRL